jgi:hypothetical protein
MSVDDSNNKYVTELTSDGDVVNLNNKILSEVETNNLILSNTKSILLYSLSLAAAFGFNDLILTIFSTFSWNNHIIAKAIYVVIMFIITLWIAFYFGSEITK